MVPLRLRRARAAGLLAVALGAACGPPDDPAVEAPSRPAAEAEPGALEPLFEAGTLDGARETVFGRLIAVTADAGGAYVLDERIQRFARIDTTGRVRYAVGRAGQGPDEFRAVHDLRLAPDGALWVLDRGNQRFAVFDVGDAETEARLRRTVPLPFDATAFCFAGDRLFVFGRHGGAMAHELDGEGRVLQSFAPDPVPDQPHLRIAHGFMTVACDAAADAIVMATDYFPIVRAFHLDGRPRWERTLADFGALIIEPMPGGGRYRDPPGGMMHDVAAIEFRPGGTLRLSLVGLASGRESDDEIAERQTRLLSLATGGERGRYAAAATRHATEGGRVYELTNDPVPRLRAYREREPR